MRTDDGWLDERTDGQPFHSYWVVSHRHTFMMGCVLLEGFRKYLFMVSTYNGWSNEDGDGAGDGRNYG